MSTRYHNNYAIVLITFKKRVRVPSLSKYRSLRLEYCAHFELPANV